MSTRSFDRTSADRSLVASEPVQVRSQTEASGHALPDAALVHSIATGDELALGELYDRFGALAYGLALCVARDPGLAEEAVQDAFISVWRYAPGFDPDRGSARTWLLTLVHRRAVVKRAVTRLGDPVERPPEQIEGSAADTADLRSERRGVQAALGSLPGSQRETIELAYYGGCSQSEIARRLSVPLGTVKSRMFAGLSHLRLLLLERDESVTDAVGR